MVLLLAGTSETAPLAQALIEAGFEVLVSMATDVPLDIGQHARMRRRRGRLDQSGLAALVDREGVDIVVDATHPYATLASDAAQTAAAAANVPYVRYARPPALTDLDGVLRAPDHETAAEMALAHGRPVLLTIGSRNVEPYARRARTRSVPLWARVLDHPNSLDACLRAGLCPEQVIMRRGPFSIDQNRETIRSLGIRVLVTKDGGEAGGARAKVLAGKEEGCDVVVVDRPAEKHEIGVASVAEVVEIVKESVRRHRIP